MNIFIRTVVLIVAALVIPSLALASGYGVFTQGASGLGQANAVVAHTTGPSSIYFNPALINDVPGRQVEVGTTAVYSNRDIDYIGGRNENGDSAWNFPSTFYYTHQANDKFTSGLGIFFPFGLSNEWDNNYDGRYIGTSGEMFTMNINPAVSYRVTDRLSLAVGLDILYLDTEIKANINQGAVIDGLPGGPPPGGPYNGLLDVRQKFSGDGWGAGNIFCTHNPLRHPGMRQHQLAGHIADRPDPGYVGCHALINFNEAARVERHTDLFQPNPLAVGQEAGRHRCT